MKTTPQSHDKGTDLIIQLYDGKTVAQAKRRKESIGIRAVQEIVTAREYHRANKGIVIITSKFTKPADKTAKQLNIELWNRKRLKQELNRDEFKFYFMEYYFSKCQH